MAKLRQDPALSLRHHSAGAKYEAERFRLFRRWGLAGKANQCAELQRYHEREAKDAERAMRRAKA